MTNDGIRTHLMAIYEKYGTLTPKIVVEEARDKQHPLHGMVFDRAAKDAAEAWYLERAREVIRVARLSYVNKAGTITAIREWHSVKTPDGFVFEPADKIATDPFVRELVLRDMEREWRQLFKRYGDFQEFVELIKGDLGEEAA